MPSQAETTSGLRSDTTDGFKEIKTFSPPAFLRNLQFVDPKAGTNDDVLLGLLSSEVDEDSKLEVFDKLYCDILETNAPLNSSRTGKLLEAVITWYKNPNTSDYIKSALDTDYFDTDIMERIADESNRYRWGEESSEAALHAYCTFQTIEKIVSQEKAPEFYRGLAKSMIYARVMDRYLSLAAKILPEEGRGPAIHLPALGAELAQTIVKHALQNTAIQNNVSGKIAPYYRDIGLTTMFEFEKSIDPEGNFMTPAQTFKELLRIPDNHALRSSGIELAVKGKTNKRDEIGTFPGTPNVGWHIAAAVGYANNIRFNNDEIRKQRIKYKEPKRTDAYRAIQLASVVPVLISLGDGAYPQLDYSLELAKSFNTPTILLIQNNRVAIGVEQQEALAQPQLWQKGHGRGIPGVRLENTDANGLYMAIRFATKRAIADAGPTIIEAMTERLTYHSNQHGDHITTDIAAKVLEIGNRQLKTMRSSSEYKRLKTFLEKELLRPGNTSDRLAIRQAISILRKGGCITDIGLLQELENLEKSIIDPSEEFFKDIQQKRYLTEEDLKDWQQQAIEEMQYILQTLKDLSRPAASDALRHTRFATPVLVFSKEKQPVITATISEAIQEALINIMRHNPNTALFGQDINKGSAIHGNKIEATGGYWRETEGLYELFGNEPGRINNLAIAEEPTTAFLLGMATIPSHTIQKDQATNIILMGGYGDYLQHALPSYITLASLPSTTQGKFARPLGTICFVGAVPGGGPWHSQEILSILNQLPSNVDLVYVTTPKEAYNTITYLARYDKNPWIVMVEKSKVLQKKETFSKGEQCPGEGTLLREGSGIQVIAYGAMADRTIEAIDSSQGRLKDIGIWKPVWMRPFDLYGLKEFLKRGSGPIVIVSPEATGRNINSPSDPDHLDVLSRGFSAQIHDLLLRDSELYKLVKHRLPIHIIGAAPVPVIPADINLLNRVIPTTSKIREELLQLVS